MKNYDRKMAELYRRKEDRFERKNGQSRAEVKVEKKWENQKFKDKTEN